MRIQRRRHEFERMTKSHDCLNMRMSVTNAAYDTHDKQSHKGRLENTGRVEIRTREQFKLKLGHLIRQPAGVHVQIAGL